MLKLATRLWSNTTEMPFLLRIYCRGGMLAGPLLLVMLPLPIVEWTLNGNLVSNSEAWGSGLALAMTTFLILIAGGCWGMAARLSNSRWALVAAPTVPTLMIAALSPGVSGGDVLQAILTSAGIYFSLFHLGSVSRYMKSESSIGGLR